MGKYFTNDSDLTNFHELEQSQPTYPEYHHIPEPSSFSNPNNLSQKHRETLEQTVDTYSSTPTNDTISNEIHRVKKENLDVSNMIKEYSEQAKTEIKDNFDKFAPIELFDKLNQLIFVVADLGNRITRLEETITGVISQAENKTNISKPTTISDPAQLAVLQQMSVNETETLLDPKIVQRELENMKKGKPSMPIDGYIDSGVQLEELYPNLDDEAYQAGYTAMAASENKPRRLSENIQTPGSMRGINGF